MAIDDAGTTVAEIQRAKAALIAELTWARLYTRTMFEDLGAISTAIRMSQPIAAGPEMKKDAEKLHDQLQSANRTVGELSDHAGIRPVSTGQKVTGANSVPVRKKRVGSQP